MPRDHRIDRRLGARSALAVEECGLRESYFHTLASFSASSPSTPLINPTIA